MKIPKVSIGLPVYNGELYIREALDAILTQTFEDFELIICDNASTDTTEDICRQYALEDKRIQYHRQQTNVGATGNFNQVFQLSSGEYFKWAAHDDLHAVDYLAKCVAILEGDRSIVLCHSQVKIIDRLGKFLKDYNVRLRTDSISPVTRFHDLLSHHLCYPIFGLIRASTLSNTPLMGNYGHADGVLLTNLALQGRFYEIAEPLFFSRNHDKQSMSMFFPEYLSLASGNPSTIKLPDYYAYAVWFDPANQRIIFPHWRIFWEYCRSIWQSSLSIKEKISCHFSMYRQLKGMEFLLLKDLLVAASRSINSAISGFQKVVMASVNPTQFNHSDDTTKRIAEQNQKLESD